MDQSIREKAFERKYTKPNRKNPIYGGRTVVLPLSQNANAS